MTQRSYAQCPFWIAKSRDEKKQITITHELPADNLGFDVKNQLRFPTAKERRDWMELFCADRYKDCPFYAGIMEKYERREEGRKR